MSQAHHPMTEAEYLAWSERQEMRYEFDGVRPIAMNGGTIGHERIQRNLLFALMTRLRGSRCEPFGPSARVPTGKGRYRYPDAVVTCSPLDPAARDVTEPVIVFEVMSDSTYRTDRAIKLVEYRDVPSISRYVMLEQNAALATVLTRRDDHWEIDVVRGEAVIARPEIPLPEIGIELPLAEIYAGMSFPPDPFQDGDPPR